MDKVIRIISQVNLHYIIDFYFNTAFPPDMIRNTVLNFHYSVAVFFLKNHSRGRAFVPKLMQRPVGMRPNISDELVAEQQSTCFTSQTSRLKRAAPVTVPVFY